jgi:hypothetical protein
MAVRETPRRQAGPYLSQTEADVLNVCLFCMAAFRRSENLRQGPSGRTTPPWALHADVVPPAAREVKGIPSFSPTLADAFCARRRTVQLLCCDLKPAGGANAEYDSRAVLRSRPRMTRSRRALRFRCMKLHLRCTSQAFAADPSPKLDFGRVGAFSGIVTLAAAAAIPYSQRERDRRRFGWLRRPPQTL